MDLDLNNDVYLTCAGRTGGFGRRWRGRTGWSRRNSDRCARRMLGLCASWQQWRRRFRFSRAKILGRSRLFEDEVSVASTNVILEAG